MKTNTTLVDVKRQIKLNKIKKMLTMRFRYAKRTTYAYDIL